MDRPLNGMEGSERMSLACVPSVAITIRALSCWIIFGLSCTGLSGCGSGSVGNSSGKPAATPGKTAVVEGGPGRVLRSDQASGVPGSNGSLSAATGPSTLAAAQWPRPSADYVGSQACRGCHAEISNMYATHPMAQSAGMIGGEPIIEDYANATRFETRPGCEYFVERTDDAVWHHQRVTDLQGHPLYDLAVQIVAYVGSGQHGRSYLIERDGQFLMSAVSWYTGKKTWDLSPGYRPEQHQRFERQIGDACLACHIGRTAPSGEERDTYQNPAILEASIGCERCHGPAGEHVRWHEAHPRSPVDRGAVPTSEGAPVGSDVIVNPAKLGPVARHAVCSQCHLQGDRRVLRPGRTENDFRPGMALSDIWVTFTKTGAVADGRVIAVSHDEQMRQSQCFQQTSGWFGCTSCHDPHQRSSGAEQALFYRSRCLKCHADESPSPDSKSGRPCSESRERRFADSMQDSCIACHMPRLAADDVPHTSQTDHRVPRLPGQSAASGPASSVAASRKPGDLPRLDVLREAGHELPEWELARAQGLYLSELAQRARNTKWAQAAEELLLKAGVDPQTTHGQLSLEEWDAWIRLTELSGHADVSARMLPQALRTFPLDRLLLQRWAASLMERGDLAQAADAFRQLGQRAPHHARSLGQSARVLEQLGDWKSAIPLAERALELDPSLTFVHRWLAGAAKRLGQDELARKHEQLAKQLQERGVR